MMGWDNAYCRSTTGKCCDPSFMSEPRPWIDEWNFRLAEKEHIAGCLTEIAMLKAMLECPTYSAAAKIEFAELIEWAMKLCSDCYEGPWPNAITQEELRKLRLDDPNRK
jgi:hypothetical protein